MTIPPLETLQKLYQDCDPDRPLPPGDPLNVPIDGVVGAVSVGPRGGLWAQRLANPIKVALGTPAFALFTGLRGSGKSTELLRVRSILEGDGYVPVVVDAEQRLNLFAEVDVADLMIPMLYDAERAVRALEGEELDRSDGVMLALWRWIERTDAEITRIEGGFDFRPTPGEGLRLVVDLRDRPPLRQRIRRTVSAYLTDFLREVRRLFGELDARARARGARGLVVALDSLEKLHDAPEVQASAHRLFVNEAATLRLPVHTLYTVPPALLFSLKTNVEFMPMVKLRDRAGARFEAGFAPLRELVRRRLPRPFLEALFGAAEVDRSVERIVDATGGYPRALVQLLRALLLAVMEDAGAVDLEAVLTREAMSIRRLVTWHAGAVDWLARVAEEHRLTTRDDAEKRLAALMLNTNAVLRYLNADEWWDVHPWVRDMDALREARARLRGA